VDNLVFSIERESHPPVGESSVLDIRVNGFRLQERVQAVEATQATGDAEESIPSGYIGVAFAA
jgi:hypothetical protein